jgi:hypothetical protein
MQQRIVPGQANPYLRVGSPERSATMNKHSVEIDDLDVEGPELSDETLRATRGGLRRTCFEMGPCSSMMGGGEDWDTYEVLCTVTA